MEKRFGKDGFYSTKSWFRARAQAIKRDTGRPCPMCGELLQRGQRFAVDHNPRRSQLPPGLWCNLGYLQTLHWSCHNKTKQAMEHNDADPVGDDGLPDNWR